MGLTLIKDGSGTYRRNWYCVLCGNGRHTSKKLSTPLRGKIPLDEDGSFHLWLKGDDAFEKSRAAALQELNERMRAAREARKEERKLPGSLEKEIYKQIKGRDFKVLRIDELADRNAEEQNRYRIRQNVRGASHAKTVHHIITRFSVWCAERSKGKKKGERCELLTDITKDIVKEYFAQIVKEYAWDSFAKHALMLAAVYREFMPKDFENPFEKVFVGDYSGGEVIIKDAQGEDMKLDKSTVAHEVPTDEQVQKLWSYTKTLTDKPYLHRLAVIAATTGLRIGDCCTLTWDAVDLLKMRIKTRPAKTMHLKQKREVEINIFDYADTEDNHPVFGELRRELEAALAERKDGEEYITPEAAKIYRANPTRLNKEGKKIFARALFLDEPEEAVLVGDEKEQKTEKEIVAIIETAKMQAEQKSRLVRVFKLHKSGKSLGEIAALIGKSKGSISEDLCEIESLSGERLRRGNPFASHVGLMKKTRRERAQGQRAACIYGWHSLRSYFCVRNYRDGVAVDQIETAMGHGSVKMILDHYLKSKAAIDADGIRELNRKRNRSAKQKRKPLALPQTAESVQSVPALPAPKSKKERLLEIQELFAEGLISEDERESQRARVLAEI